MHVLPFMIDDFLPSCGSTLTQELPQYTCCTEHTRISLCSVCKCPEHWLYPLTDRNMMGSNRYLLKCRSAKQCNVLLRGTAPQHKPLSPNVNSAALKDISSPKALQVYNAQQCGVFSFDQCLLAESADKT